MKMKQNNKPLIIGLIIIVVIIIIVCITSKKSNEIDYSKLTNEEAEILVQEKIEEMKKIDLNDMNERDRMEYYVSSFIKAIEYKDYEKAYEMLYDDFKNNYFKTYVSFEEYIKNKFPTEISLDYTNIERNGTVYVLWVTMSNPLGNKNSGIEMNFVIQENDLNDFDLSFTVI